MPTLKTSGKTRIPLTVTWEFLSADGRTVPIRPCTSTVRVTPISEWAPMIVTERPHILE
jgi:hypothetical protein